MLKKKGMSATQRSSAASQAKRGGSAKSFGGNWAVVMTGGRGTRFWPESRNARPKPFLKLLGRRTLLEEAVHRLHPLFPPERIVIVLQNSLVSEAWKIFPRIPKQNFLGEPIGRNTAPCCVYAASQIARRDPEAKLVFLPADQFVRPKALYQKILKAAFDIVDERPVLLGMRPDSPHTGYGYLEVIPKKRKINGISYFTVRRFREKPTLAQARQFLKRGNFLWNGGTFVWRVEAFKKAVREHAPKIYAAWNKLSKIPISGTQGTLALNRVYRRLPTLSIDYAVMEKMENAHCLLCAFEWKDLGGWLGVAEFWAKGRFDNRMTGALPIFIHSRRNIVKSNRRLIALVGAEDLVVIDTGDALLVCHRNETERIRDVVRELEKRNAFKYL